MLKNIEQIANNIAAGCHALREHCSLHQAADELQVEVSEDDLCDRVSLRHFINSETAKMNRAVDSIKRGV